MTRHAAEPRAAGVVRRFRGWLRDRGPGWWAKVLGPPLAYLVLAVVLSSHLAADPQRRLFPGSQGADQVGAQVPGVRDVAVVRDREPAGGQLRVERLDVAQPRAAGG